MEGKYLPEEEGKEERPSPFQISAGQKKHKLPAVRKLSRKSQIEGVLKKGTVAKGSKYLIHFRSERGPLFYLVSISKKVGIAVVRNHEKRWVREIIRTCLSGNVGGGGMIIVVKKPDGSFEDAKRELVGLFKKTGIYTFTDR